tara:strand:+ start:116740 stop:117225 length:486 start_codon:yes stop_codon:yes gene_type:complete
MNKLKLPLLVTFLLIVITACTKDDDDFLYETYTSEDLKLLHNNSSKTWKLEAHYVMYDNWVSEQNDCLVDDTYIFKIKNEVEVISGNENCYYGASEIAEAQYSFYEETGKFFLTMIRGEITEDLVKSTSFTLQLMELEENRMLFAAGEKGDYQKTLVFVRE